MLCESPYCSPGVWGSRLQLTSWLIDSWVDNKLQIHFEYPLVPHAYENSSYMITNYNWYRMLYITCCCIAVLFVKSHDHALILFQKRNIKFSQQALFIKHNVWVQKISIPPHGCFFNINVPHSSRNSSLASLDPSPPPLQIFNDHP